MTIRCDVWGRGAACILLGTRLAMAHTMSGSWFGTWDLDRAGSTLVGPTIAIARTTDGYHFDLGAANFDLGDDGRFYPTVAGRFTSLKRTAPLEWVRVHRVNGRDFERSILHVTPDQRRLIIDSDTTDPDGGVHHSRDVERRVGSGQGLAGTWQSQREGLNVSNTLVFEGMGEGRIRVGSPEEGNYFVAAPDGVAVPNQGPRATDDATLQLHEDTPREMRWTILIKGKPFEQGIDDLKADGELQETTWQENLPRERQRAVYHRRPS